MIRLRFILHLEKVCFFLQKVIKENSLLMIFSVIP